MKHVQDNAEESVRRLLDRLEDGSFTTHLDNGAQVQVAIRIDRERGILSGASDPRKDGMAIGY